MGPGSPACAEAGKSGVTKGASGHDGRRVGETVRLLTGRRAVTFAGNAG